MSVSCVLALAAPRFDLGPRITPSPGPISSPGARSASQSHSSVSGRARSSAPHATPSSASPTRCSPSSRMCSSRIANPISHRDTPTVTHQHRDQGHTMSPWSPPLSPASQHYPLPHAGAHLGSPCLSCGHLIPHRLSARSGELQAGPNGRGALGHTLATAPPGDGQPSHSHPHPHNLYLCSTINSAAPWLALTLNLAPPIHIHLRPLSHHHVHPHPGGLGTRRRHVRPCSGWHAASKPWRGGR